jgi:hypothetical protein
VVRQTRFAQGGGFAPEKDFDMSEPENRPTAPPAGEGPAGHGPAEAPPARVLTPEAQRALAEAQERRDAAEAAAAQGPTEIAGRGGLDPVRYGDWEIKGLTSDF